MSATSQPLAAVDEKFAKRVYSKISWRLIPYIFLLYILAYVDRVNLGFAALEFKRDLHLSDAVYGFGGGIFFLGQLMFDLPSNLMLGKVGPRVWIARIMITWGMVATCMMFVRGAHSFYLVRLLLGISEAGFFPGMILYLSYWFPSAERGRAVAKFMTATSIAGVVGAEAWALISKLDGVLGLHGWQWLFLLEGAPTFLMGFSVLWLLKDHPDDAAWLTDEEKKWLDGELEKDRQAGGASERHNLKDAFKLPMVWVLAGIFLLDQVGVYTVNYWMPLLLKTFLHHPGANEAEIVGRWGAIPYLAAAAFTVFVGWSSDKTGERRFHIAGCFGLSIVGFCWAAYAHSFPAALIAMTLATMGYWSLMGPFWALPTRVLGGQAAAGGVAIITMIGSIGGFSGPYITGLMKGATGNYKLGLLVVAGLALVGAGMCFLLKATGEKAAV